MVLHRLNPAVKAWVGRFGGELEDLAEGGREQPREERVQHEVNDARQRGADEERVSLGFSSSGLSSSGLDSSGLGS